MRGKEVYFDQNTTEVSFVIGMKIKLLNPSWTIRTDDWGFFFRAFGNYLTGSNSYWRSYDSFLVIMITAGITGVLWLFGSYTEFKRYSDAHSNASVNKKNKQIGILPVCDLLFPLSWRQYIHILQNEYKNKLL